MRKPENNGTRRISMKSKGTKALCILLAAGMLCSCGSEGLKRRDDTSSAAETTTVTETTTTTAQSSSVAETTTTTTTKKKKKKSNELQMLPEGCYDITPLIKAHQTGDRSKLNPTQEEILDEALRFISDCTSEDMTPVEKEIAVHDKLILETDYDSGQLSPLGDYSEDSETPYGTLINHCAICSGYAVTFNLLMKLMGIECITVEGSRSDGKPHMWNQVKLGKDWYCVDVTWDDNNFDKGTLFVKHKYLNCTTEFMKECGHDFEEADYPAAKGTKFSYMNTLMTKDPVYITNMAEFEALFNRSRENNTGEAVFIPDPYFMDPTYPFLSSTALIEEIKQLCIDNDCWYLETVSEMTENGLAAMVLFIIMLVWEGVNSGSNSTINHFGVTPFAMVVCILILDIVINTRLTEQTSLLRETQQRNRLLGQVNEMNSDFLRTVAHEFKTPLTVISGYAQLMNRQLEKGSLAESAPERLKIIRQEADRLSEIVGQLMDYTYGKNRKTEMSEVYVSELFKIAGAVLKPVCAKRNNTLMFSGDSQCRVYGNSELLLQVLINLVVNANRHTENGTITVEARDCGEMAEFVVSDNGEGISPDIVTHIFEKGFTASNGQGLGLAICSDTVSMHGGTLSLRSTGPEGSSFCFTIPKEGKK